MSSQFIFYAYYDKISKNFIEFNREEGEQELKRTKEKKFSAGLLFFFLHKKRGGTLVFFIKGGSGFCSRKSSEKIRVCGFERMGGGGLNL